MSLQIFSAEQALSPTTRRYRGRSSYGDSAPVAPSPQQLAEYDDYEDEDDENEVVGLGSNGPRKSERSIR